jgi:alpha-ribazole phosphatase
MNAMISKDRLRLHLIRHGEVAGASEGTLLGRTDRPLSERGVSQARDLAGELSAVQLTAVYSSDLQRASMTAEIIASRSHLQVERSSAWREIDMGEWEERSLAALHEEAPALVTQVFNDPASFQYPSGESFLDFIARVQAALTQLRQTHESGDIALVAHGGVCRAIIGSALGMPMKNWLRLAQDYGCLNVIEWYGNNPFLVSLNCSALRREKLIWPDK